MQLAKLPTMDVLTYPKLLKIAKINDVISHANQCKKGIAVEN